MVVELKDLAWIDDPNRVRHLAPILNLVRDQKRLAIATLNYDNSIELLANANDLPCETGLDAWSTGGEASFESDGIRLLKLHGSVDWIWQEGPSSLSPSRPMPHRAVVPMKREQANGLRYMPCVIFGQRNKLTAEGPFLDLLRVFQDELKGATILTVVGYSFRDPHINVYISNWLNGDPSRKLRIINGPDFLSQPGEVLYEQFLSHAIRLAPGRIENTRQNASAGLKSLYGQLEARTEAGEGPPAQGMLAGA
jgi:SIR2-like domain